MLLVQENYFLACLHDKSNTASLNAFGLALLRNVGNHPPPGGCVCRFLFFSSNLKRNETLERADIHGKAAKETKAPDVKREATSTLISHQSLTILS